jgi:hypothetical protein
MNDHNATSDLPVNRRAALHRLGLVVLLAGLVSAILIDWSGWLRSAGQSSAPGTSHAAGGWQDSTLPAEDTKRFSRDVEMNYGKVGVLMAHWQLWWENLHPTERWAILIATISCLIATGCFLAAQYSDG